MMRDGLAQEITVEIAKRLERSRIPIPIGVSNRHAHLSQEHFEALFGPQARISRSRSLKQPGFFAANEKIDIIGAKGEIKGVRLLGPNRPQTQIEVSTSDAVVLGATPPVRESGDVSGSSAVELVGPLGRVTIKEGLIVSRRHLHFSPQEALSAGINNGEIVRVRVGKGGIRETVFEQVLVRVSDKFSLELHLDTDEANAAGVKTGDMASIV